MYCAHVYDWNYIQSIYTTQRRQLREMEGAIPQYKLGEVQAYQLKSANIYSLFSWS